MAEQAFPLSAEQVATALAGEAGSSICFDNDDDTSANTLNECLAKQAFNRWKTDTQQKEKKSTFHPRP